MKLIELFLNGRLGPLTNLLNEIQTSGGKLSTSNSTFSVVNGEFTMASYLIHTSINKWLLWLVI